MGVSDSYGVSVDNVQLILYSKSQNLIKNGGFEFPNVYKGWRIVNELPGWETKEGEIGYGRIYNKRWPINTQVIELDGNYNTFYKTEINLPKNG